MEKAEMKKVETEVSMATVACQFAGIPCCRGRKRQEEVGPAGKCRFLVVVSLLL